MKAKPERKPAGESLVKIKKKGLLQRFLSALNPLSYLFPKIEPPPRPWLKATPVVAPVRGKILEKYMLYSTGPGEWGVAVHVTEENGKGYYTVNEPELTEREAATFTVLMEEVTRSMRTEERILHSLEHIEAVLWRAARDLGLLEVTKDAMSKYRYYLAKNLLGFWHIHAPMLDMAVEEISVTRVGVPVMVIHRRYYDLGWLETNITFSAEEELSSFCRRMAQAGGKTLSSASPLAEFTLASPVYMRATESSAPLSFRVAATLGGEVGEYSSFTIRKHLVEPLTLPFLCDRGTLSPLLGAYLWTVVAEKGSVMIIGGVGSGKTTLLNALLLTIPRNRKIATLEDTREIYLPHPNWLPLHTRTGYSFTETKFDITLLDLVKHILRQRPDYVSVGETRGAEIQGLVHAAAIGNGCLTTFHGGSLEEALARWRSPPMELSDASLNLFWCVVLMMQLPVKGKTIRKVVSVWEVPPPKVPEQEQQSKAPERERRPSKSQAPPTPPVTFSPQLLFSWNAFSDSFSPNTPAEVVRGSERLRRAFESKGLDQKDLLSVLREREKILQKCVEEKKFTLEDFLKVVG